MKSGKTVLVILLVLIVLGIGGFFLFRSGRANNQLADPSSGSNQKPASAEISDKFTKGELSPAVSFEDFDGITHTLSDYQGKAVILDFWAAWCPFCVEEMPELQAAQDKYSDQLVIIGMHRTNTESLKKGQDFARDRGVTYLLGTDPDDSLYNAAGGFGMPVAIFIDSEGMVTEIKSGPKTAQEIQEKTADLINK